MRNKLILIMSSTLFLSCLSVSVISYKMGKEAGTVHYVFLEQGATQSGEEPGHVIGSGCAQCSPEPVVKQHDGSCVFLHGWKDAQNNQRQTAVPTLCPETK